MGKFSVNAYSSLMNTKGKFWSIGDGALYSMMNFIVNIILAFNRVIYYVVDLGLQIFLTSKVLEDNIDQVFTITNKLYNSLFSALGVMLFLVAIAIIFFQYMFKSPQGAMRQLFVLIVVIGLNGWMYVNGAQTVKDVNDVFDEVESTVVQAFTFGEAENTEDALGVDFKNKSSVKAIREMYFKTVIEQPFAMINFGTVEFKSEYEELLYTEKQKTDEDAIEKVQKKVEEDSKENVYLTPDGFFDKLIFAIYAVVNNLFFGVGLLVLAMLKFLLKLVILCALVALPLLSILSFIPSFSHALFKGLGKIGFLFLGGTLIGVGMSLFYFIMQLVDTSVLSLTAGVGGGALWAVILAAVAKGLIVWLLIKFRGNILNFVTGGKVKRINNKTVDKGLDWAAYGMASAGAGAVQGAYEKLEDGHNTYKERTRETDEIARDILENGSWDALEKARDDNHRADILRKVQKESNEEDEANGQQEEQQETDEQPNHEEETQSRTEAGETTSDEFETEEPVDQEEADGTDNFENETRDSSEEPVENSDTTGESEKTNARDTAPTEETRTEVEEPETEDDQEDANLENERNSEEEETRTEVEEPETEDDQEDANLENERNSEEEETRVFTDGEVLKDISENDLSGESDNGEKVQKTTTTAKEEADKLEQVLSDYHRNQEQSQSTTPMAHSEKKENLKKEIEGKDDEFSGESRVENDLSLNKQSSQSENFYNKMEELRNA